MIICNKASDCVFFGKFVEQAEFRQKHFKYYCFGPLVEHCARLIYYGENGKFPDLLISPYGDELPS